MIESRMRPTSKGRSRNNLRRSVSPVRFAAVVIRLPESAAPLAPVPWRKNKRVWIAVILTGVAFAVLATGIWLALREPSAAPTPEEIFVFDDLPPIPQTPPPDPSPPPPVAEPQPAKAPPPQFGIQEEALSENGDMAVATGNTLMMEADSMVKAPVEELPALSQLMDRAPRILKGRPPEYPQRALDRGLQASMVVLITIDTLGRVTQVDMEKSGGRDFDTEVVRSVRQLVFQPPVRNGKPLSARFRQQYEFRLE